MRQVWLEVEYSYIYVKVKDGNSEPWTYWSGQSLEEALKQASLAAGRPVRIPLV